MNNERGRVIKFKKVTVKLVEREPTDLYSNVGVRKQAPLPWQTY